MNCAESKINSWPGCIRAYTRGPARTYAYPPVPVCTLLWLVPQKVWCQAGDRQWLLLLVSQIVSLGSLCGWGGLGLINMSILNLSWVKLNFGWFVAITILSTKRPAAAVSFFKWLSKQNLSDNPLRVLINYDSSHPWAQWVGCPRIGRNKKVFQNMSARILSHSLGSWELPKKNSAWSDMLYPSLKAAAFWQNIQRIFEIDKGKIFLWVISIFAPQKLF